MPARPVACRRSVVWWWCALAALAAIVAPAPAPASQHAIYDPIRPNQRATHPTHGKRCDHLTKQLEELTETYKRAPIVLEARVRSVSPDNVSVTFKVQRVFKGAGDVDRDMHIRLQLPDPKRPVKMDARYLLMVERTPTRTLRLLQQPTRRSVAKCLQYYSEQELKIGEKLKLSCQIRSGNSSILQWYKDDRPLTQDIDTRHRPIQRIKLQHKKKQLHLIINPVKIGDSGHYECRVKSGLRNVLKRVNVTVSDDSGENCPTTYKICQNGGTCTFIPQLKEYYCNCPTGFGGHLCETKIVSNRSSMYQYHSYACKQGIFSPYIC